MALIVCDFEQRGQQAVAAQWQRTRERSEEFQNVSVQVTTAQMAQAFNELRVSLAVSVIRMSGSGRSIKGCGLGHFCEFHASEVSLPPHMRREAHRRKLHNFKGDVLANV